MLHQICLIVLTFAKLILGDVGFSSPKQGDSFAASGGNVQFTVAWSDTSLSGSDQFSLDNAESFTLSLCTGLNTQIQCINPPIFKAKTFSDYSYDVSIPSSLIASGWWYVQMYTLFKDKSSTISYSSRFQITGMTGPTLTYIVTATGAAPAGQTSATGAAGATTYDSRSFTIPYTEQTGSYRFAPMQTQPGSKITVTTWTPRYPTSSYSAFASAAGPPRIVSTVTPGWDYTPESAVNWASVAPFPTAFYPASDRITPASLTTRNKRRWI